MKQPAKKKTQSKKRISFPASKLLFALEASSFFVFWMDGTNQSSFDNIKKLDLLGAFIEDGKNCILPGKKIYLISAKQSKKYRDNNDDLDIFQLCQECDICQFPPKTLMCISWALIITENRPPKIPPKMASIK